MVNLAITTNVKSLHVGVSLASGILKDHLRVTRALEKMTDAVVISIYRDKKNDYEVAQNQLRKTRCFACVIFPSFH